MAFTNAVEYLLLRTDGAYAWSLEGGLEERGDGELELVIGEKRDQFGNISTLSACSYASQPHTFVWVSKFYRATLYTSQFTFKDKTKSI